MCANYRPSTREELMAHFGVAPPDTSYKEEAFPGYLAPIIRKPDADAGMGQRAAVAAVFGMVPHWAELKLSRSTYNARAETVASKPSFRTAWRHGQFCIVPASVIYEPTYESGKPLREAITATNGRPLGVAGIWESKKADNGLLLFSFSMLTINADEHPLMRRMHKPTDAQTDGRKTHGRHPATRAIRCVAALSGRKRPHVSYAVSGIGTAGNSRTENGATRTAKIHARQINSGRYRNSRVI